MNTPNLDLPLMPEGTFQPWTPFNDAMTILDAVAQLVPEDKDLAAPPATVAGDVGKTWIVAASPTGAWAGKAGQVAVCVGATLWKFVQPRAGWRAYVKDESADYRYSGSAWAII